MIIECAIESCNTIMTNGRSDYSFHPFPDPRKETTQYQLWLSACKILNPKYKVNKRSRLCSKHFAQSCFKDRHKTILLDHAIPTMYIGVKRMPPRVLTLGNIKNKLSKKLNVTDKKPINTKEKSSSEDKLSMAEIKFESALLKIKPEMLKKKMGTILSKKQETNVKLNENVKDEICQAQTSIGSIENKSKNKRGSEIIVEKTAEKKVVKNLEGLSKLEKKNSEAHVKDEIMEISDESVEEVEETETHYDESEFQYVPEHPVGDLGTVPQIPTSNLGVVPLHQAISTNFGLNPANSREIPAFVLNPANVNMDPNINLIPGFVNLDSSCVNFQPDNVNLNASFDGCMNFENIMKSNVDKVWNNCKIVEKVIHCKSRGIQCEMGHEIIRNMQVEYETFVLAPHFLSTV